MQYLETLSDIVAAKFGRNTRIEILPKGISGTYAIKVVAQGDVKLFTSAFSLDDAAQSLINRLTTPSSPSSPPSHS